MYSRSTVDGIAFGFDVHSNLDEELSLETSLDLEAFIGLLCVSYPHSD